MSEPAVTFEEYFNQWMELSAKDTNDEKLIKLFSQWLDIDYRSADIVYEKNNLNNLVDFYYVENHSLENEDSEGTLYLVSGKLFSDQENQKINKLLDLLNEYLSSPIYEKIIKKYTPNYNTVFVIATYFSITDPEKKQLNAIRGDLQEKYGSSIDIETISIETIYFNSLKNRESLANKISLQLKANLSKSGDNLLIGSTSLMELYNFLEYYRDKTEDLDQIYEKNVRKFLGGRKKVNKGMQETLTSNPQQFGLYNNGITIVVDKFNVNPDGTYILEEPYIVNGCQTTKTIWEVFQQKLLNKKLTPYDLDEWKKKAEQGVVVTKIVQVGKDGEHLLKNITRYTNSQNSISEKDFITLESDFQRWSREMGEKYHIFLEIQRGGWESRLALQKQNPDIYQYKNAVNAFDLIKTYAAGWLREPGNAFGRNAAFVPGAYIYRRIVEPETGTFGTDDLYAAYHLHMAAEKENFGRGSRLISRRQTKFLFYMVIVDLVKDTLIRINKSSNYNIITDAINKIFLSKNQSASEVIIEISTSIIDEYLTNGEEYSIFNEPLLISRFNGDINGYLKSDKFGDPDFSPSLHTLISLNKRTMNRGSNPPREIIIQAINS